MAKVPFRVSARAARLIGRENVATSQGAVTELVKNAYDADADVCAVLFVPRWSVPPERFTCQEVGALRRLFAGIDDVVEEIDSCWQVKVGSWPSSCLMSLSPSPTDRLCYSACSRFSRASTCSYRTKRPSRRSSRTPSYSSAGARARSRLAFTFSGLSTCRTWPTLLSMASRRPSHVLWASVRSHRLRHSSRSRGTGEGAADRR